MSLELRLGQSKKDYKQIDCNALSSIMKELDNSCSIALIHETRLNK